jgi:beta-hydroxylase
MTSASIRSSEADDETRIILFCDVERPLRTKFMTDVNRRVCRYVARQTKTQNVDGEPVGVFNKMFGYIYQVRLVGKRIKAWNKNAY